MKTELPPPDRRKFAGNRDKLQYLYHKLLYWLYDRGDRARSRVFADRLARLLSKASPGHDAIFPEECWSLICEARHDLPGAIKHRESEISLIKRLHETSQNDRQEELVLGLYGYDDLSDRLDLLAILYHDSGQLDKALETLHESKQLCKRHGVKFDGEDLVRDYLEEKRNCEKNSDGRRIGLRRNGARGGLRGGKRLV